MKYRSEIDGLRALAVLPVIFFHAGCLYDEFYDGMHPKRECMAKLIIKAR